MTYPRSFRVANYLLTLPPAPAHIHRFTLRAASTATGMSQPTVRRGLLELEADGVVCHPAQTVWQVLDTQALAAIAGYPVRGAGRAWACVVME